MIKIKSILLYDMLATLFFVYEVLRTKFRSRINYQNRKIIYHMQWPECFYTLQYTLGFNRFIFSSLLIPLTFSKK